jgi:hypothetical protein
VVAAAWSTLAAFFLGAVLSWFVGKNIFPMIRFSGDYLNTVYACIAMALVLYLMNPLSGAIWLIIKVLLGIVTYVVFTFFLDIGGFRSQLKKFGYYFINSLIK